MTDAPRIDTRPREAPPRSWPQRLREARGPLAVCGLALLVYSPSLFCGFVRDDIMQIVQNPQVQSWEYLPQLLGSHLFSQVGSADIMFFYRPLFSVWMLLMHTVGGLAPWFWHLSNMLLHVAATYLVFRLCRRLTGSNAGAVAAAAMFAVHPMHVDAVTWISAGSEVLSTIFALAAMLALLDSRKNPQLRVWVSALWYGAGLFAKETAIAVLAILAVCAWVQLRGRASRVKRLWEAAAPYGAVTVGYLLIRWAVLHRVGVETGEHSWAEVIFTSPSILLFYLKKLFLPWSLSGCYVNAITASPTGEFWLQLTAVLTGVAAIAWLAIRTRSLLGLAAALIVIPLLPALAVIRIYPQGSMTNDHYVYLPSVGLALLVAMLVKHIWSLGKPAKLAVTGAVIAVLMAFSAETMFQQQFYRDDFAFYSRVIDVNPSDAYARVMLGNLSLQEGRVDVALEQLQTAHQIDPSNQQVALHLARGLFIAEKYREAESVLDQLLQAPTLDPKRRNVALLSLGNVEIALGNLDDARQLLQRVERSEDKLPQLHWALGVVFEQQGLLPQAIAEYDKEYAITGDRQSQQRSAIVAERIASQSAGRFSTEDSGH